MFGFLATTESVACRKLALKGLPQLICKISRIDETDRRLIGAPAMTRWIAFFRGINVGGSNLLSMKKLVLDLEAMSLKNVKTYIQSGNVVFDSESKNAKLLANSIRVWIEEEYGFLPGVLVLSLNDLQSAINQNPFPEGVSEPKSLHFFFLERPAGKPNLKALDAARTTTENYAVTDQVFYLHAPDGIGRSKLAATAEKSLGVMVTARNYRTVEKVLALASDLTA